MTSGALQMVQPLTGGLHATWARLLEVTVLVHRDTDLVESTMPVDEPSTIDEEAAPR